MKIARTCGDSVGGLALHREGHDHAAQREEENFGLSSLCGCAQCAAKRTAGAGTANGTELTLVFTVSFHRLSVLAHRNYLFSVLEKILFVTLEYTVIIADDEGIVNTTKKGSINYTKQPNEMILFWQIAQARYQKYRYNHENF